MQYNTALGFLLCGMGILSQVFNRKQLALVFSVITVLLGFFTLMQYVFGVSFGIDQLFMKHYVNASIAYDKWKSLIDSYDFVSFNSLEEFIGCPDCADGGGEWLEITTAAGVKKVIYEYGASINEIQPLIEILREIHAEFHCEILLIVCD